MTEVICNWTGNIDYVAGMEKRMKKLSLIFYMPFAKEEICQ